MRIATAVGVVVLLPAAPLNARNRKRIYALVVDRARPPVTGAW